MSYAPSEDCCCSMDEGRGWETLGEMGRLGFWRRRFESIGVLVDVVCIEMKVGLSGEVEVSEVSVSMFCHHSWGCGRKSQ
jgi:hypothetical protein